ncbi:flavin-nucleotide-binding protein [Paxillus ammoniavirescens]|nr:flavin-nucleotide-binding protein [Paxillus ammoniavirescens]
MSTDSASYPKEPRNTVNRLSKRAAYDYETVHSIINSTSVLHVSFVPPSDDTNPAPIILPMIGQIGRYPKTDDDAPSCYLHGHVSSRLMKVSSTAQHSEQSGLPVCIAATQVDGYVLALSPFSHSYNYRSAILQGVATVIDDEEEKVWAMTLITNSVIPNRWENSKNPPTNAEMQSTRILKVKIATASAKIRAEGPHDDKKDMQDEELLRKVWTGVVPVFEGFGRPVPSRYNAVETLPDDIKEYIRQENPRRKNDAIHAAKSDGPKK